MSKTPSLERKLADSKATFNAVRRRVAKLAVAVVSDERGVPERAYRELQCLFAELGGMPDLPYVTAVNGRVFAPKEELLQ